MIGDKGDALVIFSESRSFGENPEAITIHVEVVSTRISAWWYTGACVLYSRVDNTYTDELLFTETEIIGEITSESSAIRRAIEKMDELTGLYKSDSTIESNQSEKITNNEIPF